MITTIPENIDTYIAGFPEEVRKNMELIRMTIKKAVFDVREKISYGMPTFTLRGKYLVYFAGHKNHIGLYPVPENHPDFINAFSAYKTSGKGTIQFPYNKPLPLDLITRIVKFREQENLEKAAKKKVQS